jgi:PPP family 3-phenylpropionic acid transporter
MLKSRDIQKGIISLREEYRLPVFYFLLNGAFASWQSFLNLHLDRIGFSSMQIGILGAIFISTAALVIPFWGMLSDKYGNNRIFLLLCISCALLVFFIGRTHTFPAMILLIFLVSLFHQPSGAVVDGMAAGFVRENRRFSFGQFRLWSSAGYASLSLLAGYLVRQGTEIIFKVSAGMFLLISLFNLFTMPGKPVTGRSLVNFRSFGVFFRNAPLFLFLLLILLFGMAIAPLQQFINLYYLDIGAGDSFIGWVFFVQAIPEIPAYFVAARWVKRSGPEKLILFAMAVSMLRMLGYGLISRPEIAIFFSIFHCITIAFFLVGVVEYVQDRTPAHLRTTGQALIWAFHFGAGLTLGNISLGYLRDQVGMMGAMKVHAAMALLILLANLLFFRRQGSKLLPSV